MKAALAALAVLLSMASCSSLPTFGPGDLPASVTVTDVGDWIILGPLGSARSTAVVFYPGGLVRPEAYELALSPLAVAGYPVVIAKMPFDLAFFDAHKGARVGEALPIARRWVVAGHSLGGVAAAMAVDKNSDAFAGLVFWAAYPASANDLSSLSLPVLSISASNDLLSTPAKIGAADSLLPPGTEHFVIEGGNHAQFGDYGPQKGDGAASIGPEQQRRLVAQVTLAFLGRIDSLDRAPLSP